MSRHIWNEKNLDFLEFLRHRSEFIHMPVVMLSTEAADTLVDQAIAMGADAYVTKPATLEELDMAMRKALDAHGTNYDKEEKHA
jgi:DNA-binding response OmpR family regulator